MLQKNRAPRIHKFSGGSMVADRMPAHDFTRDAAIFAKLARQMKRGNRGDPGPPQLVKK
jgi:hypothetical protein